MPPRHARRLAPRKRHALAGTVHVAMRSQDLFAQRGAQTRHADDEDRCSVQLVSARTLFKPRLIKRRNIGIDERGVIVARKTAGWS
jgi:hypothetical protein